MSAQENPKVGAWLIGARGSIATTVVVGAAAISAGLAEPDGCVTEIPELRAAGLVPIDRLVFGGCDLVDTPLRKRAEQLAQAGVVPAHLIAPVAERLEQAEQEIVGVAADDGRPQLAHAETLIEQLRGFQQRTGVDQVVVVNVASTEPHPAWQECYDDLGALEAALAERPGVLPPSSLHAYAAFKAGHGFVDFTPSFGTRVPALAQLAEQAGVPFAGGDGKTGETLVKTALAPMFAHRALHVRSWYGANILGGGDGATLADYGPRASKIQSKQSSLGKLLGYTPDGTVHIDYVAELGDWKTAWNHISFEGFLGTQMKMQFTWQGCDSTLAAPLVLDLIRLTAAAQQRGDAGPRPELAFFFKDPIGNPADSRLVMQFEALRDWALAGRVAA